MTVQAGTTITNDDVNLVAECLGGNRNAFAPLVERYQSNVYNFCYRYTHNREDAGDLAQETFLRAFRHLDRYNSKYSFRSWLYTIATNTCHDWARKHNSQPAPALLLDHADHEWHDIAAPESGNPAEIVINTENTQALETAIASLPEEYRTCIILFYVAELSQAEMCEVLSLPVTIVKNRLYRARLRLRQMLEEVK